MTKTRGIRITDELDTEIRREAEARGKSWSATTSALLEEALRMRRAPGVVFLDGPSGRRAVVAGTGVDVWEIVGAWKASGMDDDSLRRDFEWLTEPQLRAALGYYARYPEEIDARLERENAWTEERVRKELPFAAPLKR